MVADYEKNFSIWSIRGNNSIILFTFGIYELSIILIVFRNSETQRMQIVEEVKQVCGWRMQHVFPELVGHLRNQGCFRVMVFFGWYIVWTFRLNTSGGGGIQISFANPRGYHVSVLLQYYCAPAIGSLYHVLKLVGCSPTRYKDTQIYSMSMNQSPLKALCPCMWVNWEYWKSITVIWHMMYPLPLF